MAKKKKDDENKKDQLTLTDFIGTQLKDIGFDEKEEVLNLYFNNGFALQIKGRLSFGKKKVLAETES